MLTPGAVIADEHGRRYQVLREMDQGGQGTVFEALELASHGRYVAKVYHPAVATRATAARLAALVGLNLTARSPALCGPFSRLAASHGVGAVQPMAPGHSLEEVFAAPTYDLVQAFGIAAAFCRALAVLEGQAVAHGDIAASNVMVAPAGAHYTVSLIDFDNAALPGAPAPTFRGQDLYAAPELLAGTVVASLRSDRFALAVLLHEILLLRHPFASVFTTNVDFQAYVALIARGIWPEDPANGNAAPPPSGLPVAVLGRDLHELFRRGLRSVPGDRPRAEEWVRQLEVSLAQLFICGQCKGLCVNEVSRVVCPYCGVSPGPLVLHVAGRALPLDRASTTIGRDDLGGDPTVSRAHVVVRRWGWGLRLRNTSLNGLAVHTRSGWIELPAGGEIDAAVGDQIRFAPGVEGVIRARRA